MATILITGATSGFGAAMARRFASGGWTVIGTGRRADRLDALASELGGHAFHPIVGDVRDVDALVSALDAVPAASELDVLVNNAGLALGTERVPDAVLTDWHTMIETNVVALVELTHALLPRLIVSRGQIMNMSSIAASYPYPGGNVYGATKAFVAQFSLNLRADLVGTGVRVTSIEPGLSHTEFTLVRTGDAAANEALYAGAHPLTAADIAETAWWIASLPTHVNVNRIELMPVSQASGPLQVLRD